MADEIALAAESAEDNEEDDPEAVATMPGLDPQAAELFEVFLSLSAGRTSGFSMANPLSAADILATWELRPICEPRYFLDAMRALDGLWIEDAAAKVPANPS